MITIQKNADEIAELVATAIIRHAKTIAQTKAYVTLALPGGRSVQGLYEKLSQSEDPIWRKIHLFLVDERVVPRDDPESNFKLIKESFAETLVKKHILPEKNIHPLVIDSQEKDFGAKKYMSLLEEYGGAFDIAVVSSGEDGHIAALFPSHRALSVSGKTYILLQDSPKPPLLRITASIELLYQAKFLLVLFVGNSKYNAYEKFNNNRIPIIDCPAKIAQKMDRAIVYTDLF